MRTLPDPRSTPLMQVAEFATYLPGVGQKAVRAAIDAGQVSHVRVGRFVLIPTVELYRLANLEPNEVSEVGAA